MYHVLSYHFIFSHCGYYKFYPNSRLGAAAYQFFVQLPAGSYRQKQPSANFLPKFTVYAQLKIFFLNLWFWSGSELGYNVSV